MKNYILPIIIYLITISLTAVIITVKDKQAAKNNQWRVSESILFTIGLLGGASAMLITMKKIRHKTKHLKFMLGLPIQVIVHICILVWIILTFGI